VQIYQNPSLASLDGLEGLTRAAELSIEDEGSLTSTEGLRNVQSASTVAVQSKGAQTFTLSALQQSASISYTGAGVLELPQLVTAPYLALGGDVERLDAPVLENLGVLAISDTTQLQSIQGLDALRVLGGLRVTNNAALVDLSALGDVQMDQMETVDVVGNAVLPTLDGLQGLTAASRVTISDNPVLSDASALGNLRVGQVEISACPALPRVEFAVLGKTAFLNIGGNAVLSNVSAPRLEFATALSFTNNPQLNALGFPLLVQLGSLTVEDNPVLPPCAYDDLGNLTATACSCSGNATAGACN
jgi:hypothetical protein